ncbi:RICIN domain-containing protein [Microdochium nivale]|nr:RICIN domain-containing protein [Microdochium nivale]
MIQLKDGMVVAIFKDGAGTCLELPKDSGRDDANVSSSKYHAAQHQHWRLVRAECERYGIWPVWNVVNVESGTALTIMNKGQGASVTCTKRQEGFEFQQQMWHLVTADAESGIFMLHNVNSTLYLDLRLDVWDFGKGVTGRKGGFNKENTHQLWKMSVISSPQDEISMELDGGGSDASSSNKKRKLQQEPPSL